MIDRTFDATNVGRSLFIFAWKLDRLKKQTQNEVD